MGTWSAAIFGNDTSCEVRTYFFEQYNQGAAPAAIHADILARYGRGLQDPEEGHDVKLALAHCLWQTCAEDSALLAEVTDLIEQGTNLAMLEGLGADGRFLRERRKALSKLLADLRTPRAKAKARVRPPVPVDSPWRNGCCLGFRYGDGLWGVVVTADCTYFQRKAFVKFAQTDIHQNSLPTMEQVRASHLLDNYFRPAEGRNLSLYSHCIRSTEIKQFREWTGQYFTIIGYLPPWQKCCSMSSGGRPPYSSGNYETFAHIITHYFTCDLRDKARTAQTVAEVTALFADPADLK